MAKSRPGVAWIKAIFSSEVRRENKQVRQDFVQRLTHIHNNQGELEKFGKSREAIRKIISKIKVNSGMPLSRKHLLKINSSVGLSLANKNDKGLLRTGIVVYRLFGKKAAMLYVDALKRKAEREQQGFDESSLFDKLGSKVHKLANRGNLDEFLKRAAENEQGFESDDIGGLDENLDNRC